MANKNILQLKDVNEKLSLSDYFILWDFEENVDEPTKKVTLAELIELFSGITSVNGKTDKDIILTSDNISSAGQTNKYITQAEKDKIAKLKTDQPSSTFLDGSGNYTNIPVVDNLTSTDQFIGLSANQGKVLKDLSDSLSVLINNITADAPTTGDSLLKLFNLISSNSSLIQDIYLILQSDKQTLDTFQEIVNFIENNRTDLNNYVLALEGKASKTTGDIEIDHTPAVVIPEWISSIYTAGKAKLRSVLDKIITEIELVKLAYMPLVSDQFIEISNRGLNITATSAPISLNSPAALNFLTQGSTYFESEYGFSFYNSNGAMNFDSKYGFNFFNPEGATNFDSQNGYTFSNDSGAQYFDSANGFYFTNVGGNQHFDSLYGFYFVASEGDINIDVNQVLYASDKEITDDLELVHKKYVDDKVSGSTIPDASTTIKGKVQLATVAEGTTGTDTEKVATIEVAKAMILADINALVNGAGAAYNTLKELEEEIIANDGDIASVLTTLGNKLNVSDVLDVLTSTATNKALSANQGKVLKGLIDTLNSSSLQIAPNAYDESNNTQAITPAHLVEWLGFALATKSWNFTSGTTTINSDSFIVNTETTINAPLNINAKSFFSDTVKVNGYLSHQTNIHEADISGATSIDLQDEDGNHFDVIHLTLTGNVTSFDVTNPVVGKTYKLYLIQDATGNRTITGFAPKFKTENNVPILLSTEANTYDMLQLEIIDTDKITIFPIYSVW